MDNELISTFLTKKNIFAVVGVSRNSEKIGYQVYRDLKNAGYKVYPINPNSQNILGNKCYPNLESLPEKPDVVNLVVPPKVTEKVVETCKELGVPRVWMQPGSESEKALKFCKNNGIEVVHDACIMIELGKQKSLRGNST
jgi:uncharacterized protein